MLSACSVCLCCREHLIGDNNMLSACSVCLCCREHLIGDNNRLTRPRPANRPPRPPTRAAVVDWFKLEEKPRGVHLDSTGNIAPWFHGKSSLYVNTGGMRGCVLILPNV